jgi:DNA-binding transcriptional ArsR family regulator
MNVAAAAQPEHLPGPRRDDLRLELVLAALSDPIRLLIVRKLAETADLELPCGSFSLPVGKSTASHHFRVLREAGVIHQHHRGRQRLNELRHADLDARFPGLLHSVVSAA